MHQCALQEYIVRRMASACSLRPHCGLCLSVSFLINNCDCSAFISSALSAEVISVLSLGRCECAPVGRTEITEKSGRVLQELITVSRFMR